MSWMKLSGSWPSSCTMNQTYRAAASKGLSCTQSLSRVAKYSGFLSNSPRIVAALSSDFRQGFILSLANLKFRYQSPAIWKFLVRKLTQQVLHSAGVLDIALLVRIFEKSDGFPAVM